MSGFSVSGGRRPKSANQKQLHLLRFDRGPCVAILLLLTVPAAANSLEYTSGPSIASSLPTNGDPAGIRKSLADRGVTFNLTYINDVLANVRGGARRGVIDQGRLDGALTLDLEKLAGLSGLSVYGNFFQIHNTGRIRRDYVGGINTIAAIEAVPTTRLWELWLEQKFWNGKASIKVGQLAADTEFYAANISSLFLQSDWPTIAAANLPSGGPAYPLSTPGVRLKIDPTDHVSLLAAVFNGDPAGPGEGDEQLRNRHGLNFRTSDPPFVMAEAQFRTNHGKEDSGLARTIKLGGWAHFGDFEDQRFADDGTVMADPSGSGEPLVRKRNWGVYGIIEQQVYRPKGGDAESGISLFSRVSFSPSDRNPIDFFADGGIIFAGMVPGRPDDKFGASVMYARVSDSVRAFDRDPTAFSAAPGVIHDYEMNLELTYSAQIVPGWTVQPVLTYVWHPGGGDWPDALVVGGRSIWRF
jgi:porin